MLLFERLLQILAVLARVAIEDFPKKRFLIPERRVHAGTIDSHGLGEIGQRGAFISLGAKDFDGLVESFFGVKGARTPNSFSRSVRHCFASIIAFPQTSVPIGKNCLN